MEGVEVWIEHSLDMSSCQCWNCWNSSVSSQERKELTGL